METIISLKPDSKGRITLGKFAKGVSSYHATFNNKDGLIVLKPFVEVPMCEQWLYRNKTALNSVLRGINESAKGETILRDRFTSEEQ